ncbi:MAG: transcriptional regulator, family [Bryobacterales bacterium]|nr:transcriptional regulator, family [Bryobacterales bacterium]
MSRLRVRIELNRGGVGVPLDKLASVVQQAQSFFRMLGDDVHIDQSQGEWLGFDFDHESLNFTAEFVGPVTQDQVAAFHSAFDGTTGLRRATIAQFARIADAIEEDEVIGFGLYLNEGEDPGEWRCLSRRDALRITEEIRVLLGAGEGGQESHLPAVADLNAGGRYLFGRRDRAVDMAKVAGAVREVEANLSKRISRLEGDVADHSSHIHDLRARSIEAEQSMGRLLSAVEGFCEQAANRLETVTAPALSAARAPIQALPEAEAPSKVETPSLTAAASVGASPAVSPVTPPSPVTPTSPLKPTSPVTAASPIPTTSPVKPASPVTATPPSKPASPLTPGTPIWATSAVTTAAPFTERPQSTWWRSPIVILVGLGTAVILLGILFWPNSSSPGSTKVTSASEPVRSAPAPVPAPAVTPVPTTSPSPVSPAAKPAASDSKPAAKASAPAVLGARRIELEASEPSWVSIRSRDGATQIARLIEPGSVESVDINEPAVLRAGNAGGLTVRTNGKSIGPLGPHGAIREIEFKNGGFKLVPVK